MQGGARPGPVVRKKVSVPHFPQSHSSYREGVTALDAPFEFVSVTVTETMLVDCVFKVNGTVSVNWVPNGFDWTVFEYQVVKAAARETVISD